MLSGETKTKHHQVYVIVLFILLALFCFRVLAQLLQLYIVVPFLPPFEAWQSGAVPYRALLVAQVLIIVFYASILRRFVTGRMRPNRKQGWTFLVLGSIYFLAMIARLLVGLGGLSEHYWFHSYLPTLFHFVIAGYLIVVGWFHLRTAERYS